MEGERIDYLKKALDIFLRSLPQNCYFNIYSFGTSFSKTFDKSVLYNDENMNYASEELNIDKGSITKCCQHKRKTAGGYIWEYYSNYIK